MSRDSQIQDAAFKAFYQVVDQWVGMPKAEWQQVLPNLKLIEAEEKTVLQEIGKPAKHTHFIYQGLVRYYYLDEQGREMNKGFYREGWPVGNLSAMVMQEPSRFAIETLEPSTLVRFESKQGQEHYPNSPAWERFFNRSCQLLLVRNERREAELLSRSARDRYRQFVKNFPDLQPRIPQYHIASYLGITPVALSKYKKQWLAEAED